MIEYDDISIYCDGFLKYKDKETGRSYTNGGSIGILFGKELKYTEHYMIGEERNRAIIKAICENDDKVSVPLVEYFALYKALKEAGMYKKPVYIFSDAEIVVKQFNGEYNTEKRYLKTMLNLCKSATPKNFVRLCWVGRLVNVKILGH